LTHPLKASIEFARSVCHSRATC